MTTLTAEKSQVNRATRTATPRVDIWETPDGFVLLADLPGVAHEDLSVEVHENRLTIVGEVDRDLCGLNPVRREYAVARFERSFQLSKQVQVDGIQAHLKDGQLRLELPLAEERKPRKIQIRH